MNIVSVQQVSMLRLHVTLSQLSHFFAFACYNILLCMPYPYITVSPMRSWLCCGFFDLKMLL